MNIVPAIPTFQSECFQIANNYQRLVAQHFGVNFNGYRFTQFFEADTVDQALQKAIEQMDQRLQTEARKQQAIAIITRPTSVSVCRGPNNGFMAIVFQEVLFVIPE